MNFDRRGRRAGSFLQQHRAAALLPIHRHADPLAPAAVPPGFQAMGLQLRDDAIADRNLRCLALLARAIAHIEAMAFDRRLGVLHMEKGIALDRDILGLRRLYLFPYFTCAAIGAASEILPRDDALGLQCGKGQLQPVAIGHLRPALLGGAMLGQRLAQRRRRFAPQRRAGQFFLEQVVGIGQNGVIVEIAAQHVAPHLVAQRRHGIIGRLLRGGGPLRLRFRCSGPENPFPQSLEHAPSCLLRRVALGQHAHARGKVKGGISNFATARRRRRSARALDCRAGLLK